MRKPGFDVSLHQGAIDWALVEGAALDFVFIRAQVGLTVDTLLQNNLNGAAAIGLESSVYHVVHEDISGETQAGAFLDLLAAMRKPRLPVVLDVERPMYAGSTAAHKRTLEVARVMSAMLEAAGYRVMIYTGAWWWDPASVGVDVSWAEPLDLWVATYGTQAPFLPRGWREWRFWQYTNSGTVVGIASAVDLNVFQGDWEAYLGVDDVDDVPTVELRAGRYELLRDGVTLARFVVPEAQEPEAPPEHALDWALPVGTAQYPPLKWGVRGYTHDLRTTEENPNRFNGKPHPHTGYDINLDVPPYGDVERGFPVFACAAGVVHYVTDNWSGVGMCVILHDHDGVPVWFRYAHIDVMVRAGDAVEAGQTIGFIADWPNEGDHLHMDAALDPFTREWIAPDIRWIDPAPILCAHIDPALVFGMLRVGD
ncbi:MAG: peptidoglycan DD-metalloendopeptidase family protein [Anaerolineae bacterium]|nr:peptidoglycan DD-metalloendopeptidase family protein [Anaerolineae bacterium]